VNLWKTGCQEERWTELAQHPARWRSVVLVVLNLLVVLPESYLIIKMALRDVGCEDGRWMDLAPDRVL
jgi:hypothetical protein